jgi:hypothetical protein
MHIRTLLVCIPLICWQSVLMGQNAQDALIHSQTTLSGTARSLGMGGAFSVVGADLSTATTNPAGLGFYRSSSFVITPEFNLVTNRADYLDRRQFTSNNGFRLPSLGIAFNTMNLAGSGDRTREVQNGIVSYTFALGYNNLENYNRSARSTRAFNPFSSITNSFAEAAEGIPANDLIAFQDQAPVDLPELYWNTFTIDVLPGGDSTSYYPVVNDGRISQTFQLLETGRRNEWYAALGANFSNKFYLGGAIGLQQIRYERVFDFNEDDLDNFHEFYNNDPALGPLEFPTVGLRYTEQFTTRGTGLNGKIGFIYRPVDALRIGVSAQTPTYFSLTDRIGQTNLDHTYVVENLAGQLVEETLSSTLSEAQFEYSLATPFRATAGLMYLIGKSGFLSADLEYVDYQGANFISSSGSINDPNAVDFTPENNEIDALLQPALNLRVGGEARVDVFRLRAGFAYNASPLSDAGRSYLALETNENDYRELIGQAPGDLALPRDLDGSRVFFTLGAGLRQPNFFIDVSLVNQRQLDKFSPYSLASDEVFQPNVINRRVVNRVTVSLGANF